MYGKETQKLVGCCVPWCEEPRCDRKYKKKCALRKYFILEVISLRKINDKRLYFWRKDEYKRKQIEKREL